MKQAAVALVLLAALETREAMSAYARFGKGRGHPAQRNPGDCFSYVCARPNAVPPLFVVKNLSQTDIA